MSEPAGIEPIKIPVELGVVSVGGISVPASIFLRYGKDIGIALSTVLIGIQVIPAGNGLSTFVQVALLVAGAAAAVLAKASDTGVRHYIKALIPAVNAALIALAPLVIDGSISWSDGNLAVVALITALVGYAVPSEKTKV